MYQIHSVDDGWQDVDIAEYEEWAYKKRIVYPAPPSAAPVQPATIDHMSDALLDAGITARFQRLCKAIGYADPSDGRGVMEAGILFSAFGAMAGMLERAAAPAGDGGDAIWTDEAIRDAAALAGFKTDSFRLATLVYGPDRTDITNEIRALVRHVARHAPTGADAERIAYLENALRLIAEDASRPASHGSRHGIMKSIAERALVAKRGGA